MQTRRRTTTLVVFWTVFITTLSEEVKKGGIKFSITKKVNYFKELRIDVDDAAGVL